MELIDVEVWVMVDEDGDYEIAKDKDELTGPTGLATRLVKVMVKVPKPQPVEVEAEVSEEPGKVEVKVK
jgi:hypothetical protein